MMDADFTTRLLVDVRIINFNTSESKRTVH